MTNPDPAREHAALERAFHVHQQGDLVAARSMYLEVIRLNPVQFNALQLLGVLSIHESNYAEADRWLTAALKVNPQATDVMMNHAIVLQELARPLEAIAQYDRLLKLSPLNANAWSGRGIVLNTMMRLNEAEESFTRAIQIDPNFIEPLFNRGSVYFRQNILPQALADFDAILSRQPEHTDALFNRGLSLLGLHDPSGAASVFERLIRIDPAFPLAKGFLAQARWNYCDWTDYEPARLQIISDIRAGRPAALAFQFLSISGSASDQLACVAKGYSRPSEVPGPLPTIAARAVNDKIRIAYISPDFGEHPVTYLSVGLIEQHDRSRFEVIGVHLGTTSSGPLYDRICNAFDRLIPVAQMTDRQVVERLRDLRIDIAVDLAGGTGGARGELFAWRSAPLQVNFLGYPGTLGTSYMDYLIADEYVIPQSQEQFYRERIVRLPDTFQPNDDLKPISTRAQMRSMYGLPDHAFVFCTFHSAYKFNPEFFDLWMRILKATDDSVLWILANDPKARKNLAQHAQQRGVSPDRLIFAKSIPYPEHLARYGLADLVLDMLPFNGGTTSSDALWAGVPLLTCSGEAFAARMSGSLLKAVGLPELIAEDIAHYERLAVSLAKDRVVLTELRARLRTNRLTHPLFDTRRFARSLERAYTMMVERAIDGSTPLSFSVPSASGDTP